MKRHLYKLLIKPLTLIFILSIVFVGAPTALAAESPVITSVDELTTALMNAKDGDTILVGDITFQPMPMGMIIVPKNVTIKSGKDTNAVFTNATFALNGTTTDSAPLTVKFENIDFRGDQSGTLIDPNSPPLISSAMPDIMKTMCAAIFKMNVDATYTGCSFEGYHYGYGGVFNAVYSADDNKNALNLTLIDCSFRNNASKFGGSIYLSGYNHNVSLVARQCVFEDNTATTGGAIWAEECNVHLLDCSLTGNMYLNAEEVDSPNGGALALYNCGAELNGCLIANNTSGGDGAGIFCAIAPFKTLIMENCTVIGNVSTVDEGISLGFAATDFDTAAKAHIYYSSLFGEQNFADNVELFGCLLACKNVSENEPSEKNDYCLELTPERAKEKGLIPEIPEHVSLPAGEYPIPKEVTDTIAGGKFADSLGELQVGDNYEKEATIEIENTPGHAETVTVQYGDELLLEQSKRDGYSFEGWEYPQGAPIESGKVFIGGELPEGKVTARWHFVLSENLYVIWVPILVIAAAGLLAFALIRRKKKASEAVPTDVTASTAEETVTLPDDWIGRVCEKPEIAELISKREMEVLQKLLEGKSRKQIADELFVTEATIKKHSASIYSKLDVHNRTELIYKLTKQ